MNEIQKIDIINIEDKIYEINGKEVMLDSDLAELYKCKNGTKEINQAVKNNQEKFPKRFSWILTDEEKNNLWSKFSTANISNMSRSNPRVFTEQGVYMLATILKSKVATEVSIRIMDAFVKMRHYINYNNTMLPNRMLLLEDKVDNNTKRIDKLFDLFNPKDIVKDKAFFEGEFYDSHSFLLEVLNSSIQEVIIIDNYADKELLNILRKIDRKIIIISKNIDEKLKEKYEKQYNNVTFVTNNSFHDRFIILDRKHLFSCGSSFKDLGKKCFVITKIETKEILSNILKIIE